MNKQELARELHISRQALDKRLKRHYKDISMYIKVDENGRFIDFDVNGLETLRNTTVVTKKQPEESKINILEKENIRLGYEIQLIKIKLKHVEELRERDLLEIAELKERLNQYNSNWFSRLLIKK